MLSQAGRAGRDGLQSDCILVWSQGDMNKNEFIKVSFWRGCICGVCTRARARGRACVDWR